MTLLSYQKSSSVIKNNQGQLQLSYKATSIYI